MKLTLEQAEQMMKKSNGNLDLYERTDITELPDNLIVGGYLDLSNTKITSLPDNLTVGGYLDLSNTKITSLPDNLTIGGGLYLNNTAITSLPDNLTVDGDLDLRNAAITSLPNNLTVGRYLDLSNTKIKSLPDNLTVGGILFLSNTAITSLPDNFTVGRGLYLSDTMITSLPDNLTVGGCLDLSNTKIKSLPDNLTIGGSLALRNTAITSLPNNLTVGGGLYLSGTKIADKGKESSKVKRLKDGDYVPNRYIYADRILTHIRAKRHIDGYDLYVGKIKGHNVISDGKHYAHCRTFKEGVADLLFKNAKDRGAEQYKDLTLDSTVTKDEAITMYRIITGACRQGTEQFVNSLGKLKDTYTVKEIIKLTKGQYNSECFEKFFER